MNIDWDKILLVWNRGHKNFGDEIILVWNIKILLEQWKTLIILCSNKSWLKQFHKQFFDLQINTLWFYNKNTGKQVITYLNELPKWFRSLFRFLKDFKLIKKYFEADSIIVWWWEILTEETPYSYWYWFFSTWILLPFKKLYLTGWIQIPKKFWNKLVYKIFFKKAKKIYIRDFDLLKLNNSKVKFYPDSSLYAVDGFENYQIDEKNFKWIYKPCEKNKQIVININKKAEQFFDEIREKINYFYRNNYEIYFARICKSPTDDDIVYYHKLKTEYLSLKLLDWENFEEFLNILKKSEKVFTTRLHLFLISYYLWLDVQSFVYQKKVEKMRDVLAKKHNFNTFSYK